MRKFLKRLLHPLRYQIWLRTQYVPIAGGAIIERDDASALMPEEVSSAFLKNLENQSAVLNTFTRVPVGKNQVRFPVLSALPTAGFVGSTQGNRRKPTTKVSWDSKELNIEELAVIVAVEEDALDDSDTPIWSTVRPLAEQAIGRALDAAVFFGDNAPTSWPDDVVTSATAADNVEEAGTAAAEDGGLVADHGQLLSEIELDGYDPRNGVASRVLRGLARRARNADGDRFAEIEIDADTVEIDGVRYSFPMRGQWPAGAGQPIAIPYDPTEFVVGVRQDVTWKLLDQAVIQDDDGEILYNLAQEDLVALRVVARVGWQVANTINYDEPTEADRYPAGVLTDTVAS